MNSFKRSNRNLNMNDSQLTDEELRNASDTLKANKSPGYDDISFNAINNVFDL